MNKIPYGKVIGKETFEFEFSVCTLVTNMAEYREMQESFLNSGFTEDICEYIYIDNSKSNAYEAYAGLNRFLREAKGKYIILCHQDILLKDHQIDDLRDRVREVDNLDPKWAIISNAGGINLYYTAMHLIQGTGSILHEEHLPLITETVDENFILVKKEANLTLSADLEGFHLYGTDICLIADILGYTSYVIDFKLMHKSDGNADEKFDLLERKLIKKYRRALRSRFIGTTITRFYISGNRLLSFVYNTTLVLFVTRQFYKHFKRKKGYHTEV